MPPSSSPEQEPPEMEEKAPIPQPPPLPILPWQHLQLQYCNFNARHLPANDDSMLLAAVGTSDNNGLLLDIATTTIQQHVHSSPSPPAPLQSAAAVPLTFSGESEMNQMPMIQTGIFSGQPLPAEPEKKMIDDYDYDALLQGLLISDLPPPPPPENKEMINDDDTLQGQGQHLCTDFDISEMINDLQGEGLGSFSNIQIQMAPPPRLIDNNIDQAAVHSPELKPAVAGAVEQLAGTGRRMIRSEMAGSESHNNMWTKEEDQHLLHHALPWISKDENVNFDKCFAIARGLPNKIVADVAYRIMWFQKQLTNGQATWVPKQPKENVTQTKKDTKTPL